jgi:hypothetical protein
VASLLLRLSSKYGRPGPGADRTLVPLSGPAVLLTALATDARALHPRLETGLRALASTAGPRLVQLSPMQYLREDLYGPTNPNCDHRR